MAARTGTKKTAAKTPAKTPAKATPTADNGYRAMRMAKGYGRESLAAALGIRMADVWAIEKAPTLSAADRKALQDLPSKGNPLQERTEPVNKPVRTKTAEQIKADAEARNAHPVTVARKGKGYTREGLAQAMGISTTALWHLEQTTGADATAAVKAIKALPQGSGLKANDKVAPVKGRAVKPAPSADDLI
jgi:DNA-binding XRE family transcriptional regulator